MTSNFLDNACTKIQNMAFETSKLDQIALEYWYYAFLGSLRVAGRGFLHQKPILKKRSPEQKSRCRTCAEACHSPFKLDCKTVGIFAHSSTRARKTLTPRFTDFFTDFVKKKPTVLQSTLTKSVKYTLLLISNSLLSFGIYRSKIESI